MLLETELWGRGIPRLRPGRSGQRGPDFDRSVALAALHPAPASARLPSRRRWIERPPSEG